MSDYHQICTRINAIVNSLDARISQELKPYDITYSQALVLCTLVLDHKGSCTQQALREVIQISPSSLSGILKRLEHKGLILKRENTTDTRLNDVSATERAYALMPKIQESLNNCVPTIVKNLHQAESPEALLPVQNHILNQTSI